MLEQFTIYDRPKDFPSGFVVRRWEIDRSQIIPRNAEFFHTLADARKSIPPGLMCLHRAPNDDPRVVEVWI